MDMYDSLGYVKKLVAAGVPRQQAETQVEIMSDILVSTFATKQDLKDLSFAMSADITEFKTEMRSEITEFKTEMRSEITELRTEMRSEITELRTEMRSEITELRTEMNSEFSKVHLEISGLRTEIKSATLVWGSMLAGAVTLMIATVGVMLRFFPPVH